MTHRFILLKRRVYLNYRRWWAVRRKKSKSRHFSSNPMKRFKSAYRLFVESWLESAILEVLLLHLVFFTVATWKFDNYLFSIWGPYWFIYHHPVATLFVALAFGSVVAIKRIQTKTYRFVPALIKRRTV
jgi:hypothetical protein